MRLIVVILLIFLPTSLQSQINQQEFYNLLIKYEIKCPEVVLRQAICECGHNFNSTAAKYRNNYLGIANGNKIFDSVDSCIIFYKKQFNDKFTGSTNEEYYKFLNCMWIKSNGSCQRYAMKETYTSYLKRIKPKL